MGQVHAQPGLGWVVQQARNVLSEVPERTPRFLIRDRDAKFSGAFDDVFLADGARVIQTALRAPRANAHAERWVRTVRAECLDHLLITSRRHLDRVLAEYVGHYNRGRPHRGLGLEPPETEPREVAIEVPKIRRRDLLGGLIHEYEPIAA